MFQVNESTFKLVQFRFIAVDLRIGRKVEITLPFNSHDAEIIHLIKFTLMEYAITKGIEAMFLPSQL